MQWRRHSEVNKISQYAEHHKHPDDNVKQDVFPLSEGAVAEAYISVNMPREKNRENRQNTKNYGVVFKRRSEIKL